MNEGGSSSPAALMGAVRAFLVGYSFARQLAASI